MSVDFKIFLENSLDNNKSVVLLRGNLLEYTWNSLKMKMIENSNNSYFINNNLEIKDNNFFLEIIETFNNDFYKNLNIYNQVSFSYLIEKIKEYQNKNPNKNISLKLSLRKADNIQKLEIDKNLIYLKDILNTIWKKEKQKIKEHLNEIELANSEINFLAKNNKNYKHSKKLNLFQNNNICNNCLSINFDGYKYTCAYCTNYNLCYNCFKEDNHNKEHNFILFKKIKEYEEIYKYNNKIIPNSMIFTNKKESFYIDFKIANTGEKDLINCFIGYIKFDKNYLYCDKYEIRENFKSNENKEITIKIFFDDLDIVDFTIFEGHFRMFTKLGTPFGDILKIKIINYYTSK